MFYLILTEELGRSDFCRYCRQADHWLVSTNFTFVWKHHYGVPGFGKGTLHVIRGIETLEKGTLHVIRGIACFGKDYVIHGTAGLGKGTLSM